MPKTLSPSAAARKACKYNHDHGFHPQTRTEGAPGRVTHVGPGLYDVESSRGGRNYRVNLNPNVLSCECPHHQMNVLPALRNGKDVPLCKHLAAAREERKAAAVRVARGLTNAELAYRLDFHSYPDEIAEAINEVLRERGFFHRDRLSLAA